jgi:hypothetical protein
MATTEPKPPARATEGPEARRSPPRRSWGLGALLGFAVVLLIAFSDRRSRRCGRPAGPFAAGGCAPRAPSRRPGPRGARRSGRRDRCRGARTLGHARSRGPGTGRDRSLGVGAWSRAGGVDAVACPVRWYGRGCDRVPGTFWRRRARSPARSRSMTTSAAARPSRPSTRAPTAPDLTCRGRCRPSGRSPAPSQDGRLSSSARRRSSLS